MKNKKKVLACIMSSIIALSCAACNAGNNSNTLGNAELNSMSSTPNTPVYDVDKLCDLLDTRPVDLYNESGLLYGKYEQCEEIKADGEYGVKYGDLTILSSEASDGIVQISTTNPKTFQKNGISLDKSYEELVAILGVPEFGGSEQGIYWWTFMCDGYSLSVRTNDPAQAPYEVIIHY